MKKNKTLLYIILVIAVLLALKYFFLNNSAPTNAPQQSGKPQSAHVNGIIVKAEKLDNKVFISGTILANEEVELHAEASGRISQLLFKEGSEVRKGELLLKLNDADLQAQLKKTLLQEKLSSDKEVRQKKLLDISGISSEEYEQSLNELNSLRADEDYLHAQIAKTEIRAPFDGKVGLKYVSEGSYVSPSVKIASLQQINPAKIDFSVPEKYASVIKKNNAVNFSLSGSSEVFKGTVYAVEPKVDIATRTLHVRAMSENKNEQLVPGSFVKIELVLNETEDALLIPTEAVIPDLKGKKVFVSREGKAQPQMIETGVRTDEKVQVTSGLQIGDTVITSGIMSLKPGAVVVINLKDR